MSSADEKQLFDYVLVAGLEDGKTTLKYRFPPDIKRRLSVVSKKRDETLDMVEFCFPEVDSRSGSASKLKRSMSFSPNSSNAETFSFVLTSCDGGKRFGYCRRFLGSAPETYCIISRQPSFALFSQILDVVEVKRKVSSSSIFAFLKAILAHPFPSPGGCMRATVVSHDSDTPEVHTISHPPDDEILLNYVTFGPLLELLSVTNLVYLFDALLQERRVIVCASKLSILSNCVAALSALLLPFVWQQVYIPVLPASLLDYCAAPMPFLVGVLETSLEEVLRKELEDEVVVVNVDKDSFLRHPTFPPILPSALSKNLVKSIDIIVERGKADRKADMAISHVFFQTLFSLCGDYYKFIKGGEFIYDQFLASKSGEHQEFVKMFRGCQLFMSFIQEREMLIKEGKQSECVFYRMSNDTDFGLKILEQLPTNAYFCVRCNASLKVGEEHIDSSGRIRCAQCNAKRKKQGFLGRATSDIKITLVHNKLHSGPELPQTPVAAPTRPTSSSLIRSHGPPGAPTATTSYGASASKASAAARAGTPLTGSACQKCRRSATLPAKTPPKLRKSHPSDQGPAVSMPPPAPPRPSCAAAHPAQTALNGAPAAEAACGEDGVHATPVPRLNRGQRLPRGISPSTDTQSRASRGPLAKPRPDTYQTLHCTGVTAGGAEARWDTECRDPAVQGSSRVGSSRVQGSRWNGPSSTVGLRLGDWAAAFRMAHRDEWLKSGASREERQTGRQAQ
eukprot:CAMPEP_0177640562 /NCGR_PEP_ID=MMETSP0447-20121125/6608_1 /TAXON_ID=0 /ORGANISM="Stygamoeba regulata, Strain BSH-02190019" /LENGTH=733 /DNA_ID=CAMNT_0019142639 /DNA_START=31 /DNA_END=2232 /DNA_ORIENTATION=+